MQDKKPDYLKDDLKGRPQLIAPDDGERIGIHNSNVLLKITSAMTHDQFGVYQIELAPQSMGADLHYHRFMEELFIVVSGNLTVTAKDAQYKAKPGTMVHIPKFTVHGFKNDTDSPVKVLLFFNPSMGREGFFNGLKQVLEEKPFDQSRFEQLYGKYDSVPYKEGTL